MVVCLMFGFSRNFTETFSTTGKSAVSAGVGNLWFFATDESASIREAPSDDKVVHMFSRLSPMTNPASFPFDPTDSRSDGGHGKPAEPWPTSRAEPRE